MKKVALAKLRLPGSDNNDDDDEKEKFTDAYLLDSHLHISATHYINLDFINHKHVVTRNATLVYLARPSERRMKLLEAFSRKRVLSRIVLNVECVSEEEAQSLLKKFVKIFNINATDFKRIEFDQNRHYNKVEVAHVPPGTPGTPRTPGTHPPSIHNTNSYLSDQQSIQSTINTIESIKSVNKVGIEVPDEIPYKKRPSLGGADLINSSGRKSFNDTPSTSVSDIIPVVVRSKTAPSKKELNDFPSIPVA
ncbi:hypothetical protein E3P99_03875 [Wallemia hederae]|uniref:Uncharacterized protein n=1 Tax=Wallemia hederae TaxID=1540922 RepID=A0A4T0FDI8_9BASI|nr:hypothetical protein E3P99_03875 [Wallemia hederae]